MTRDEAILKAKNKCSFNHSSQSCYFTPVALVDALEALGMLKLDEPKSVSDRFIDALEAHVEHKRIGDLLHALDCANLKIVEK